MTDGALSPFSHELDSSGTRCADDCAACRWVREREGVQHKIELVQSNEPCLRRARSFLRNFLKGSPRKP
jgi:hypothetical protein